MQAQDNITYFNNTISLTGPRFQRKAPSCPRMSLGHHMIPSIPLVCQALVRVPTDAQAGSPTHICCVQLEGGLPFKWFRKCLTTGIQLISKARLSPTSFLLPSLGKSVQHTTHVLPKGQTSARQFVSGRKRSHSNTSDPVNSSLTRLLHTASTQAFHQHTAKNLFDHLIKHSPSLALLSPQGKADNFLLHLFCLHIWEGYPSVFPSAKSIQWVAHHQIFPNLQDAILHFTWRRESTSLAPEQYAPPFSKTIGLLNHTFQDLRNLIW